MKANPVLLETCMLMKIKTPASAACAALKVLLRIHGEDSLIALDRKGRFAIMHHGLHCERICKGDANRGSAEDAWVRETETADGGKRVKSGMKGAIWTSKNG